MPLVLGIPLGIVVALVGGWLLIVVIRLLLRTALGVVALAVLVIVALVAGVAHIKRHGQQRHHVAVSAGVGLTTR